MSATTNIKAVRLAIPSDLQQKYNDALTQVDDRYNLLVGYEKQLNLLDAALYDLNTPSAIIIGDPGVGKTSVIKQLAHNRYQADRPLCIVD